MTMKGHLKGKESTIQRANSAAIDALTREVDSLVKQKARYADNAETLMRESREENEKAEQCNSQMLSIQQSIRLLSEKE